MMHSTAADCTGALLSIDSYSKVCDGLPTDHGLGCGRELKEHSQGMCLESEPVRVQGQGMHFGVTEPSSAVHKATSI